MKLSRILQFVMLLKRKMRENGNFLTATKVIKRSSISLDLSHPISMNHSGSEVCAKCKKPTNEIHCK